MRCWSAEATFYPLDCVSFRDALFFLRYGRFPAIDESAEPDELRNVEAELVAMLKRGELAAWGEKGLGGNVHMRTVGFSTIPLQWLNKGILVGLQSQMLFIKGAQGEDAETWFYPCVKRADIERLVALKTTMENKEQRSAVTNTPLTKEHVTATETVLWILNKEWLSYAEWEDQHRAADLFWDVPDEFVYRTQRAENGGSLPLKTTYDFDIKTLARYAQVKAEGRGWNPDVEQAGEFGIKSAQALQQWFASFCTKNDIECDYKILASSIKASIEKRAKFETEIQTAFAELCSKLRDSQLKMTGRPTLTNGVQQVIPSDAFRLPNMLLIAQLNRTYTEGRNADFDKNDWVDLALVCSEVEQVWPANVKNAELKERYPKKAGRPSNIDQIYSALAGIPAADEVWDGTNILIARMVAEMCGVTLGSRGWSDQTVTRA